MSTARNVASSVCAENVSGISLGFHYPASGMILCVVKFYGNICNTKVLIPLNKQAVTWNRDVERPLQVRTSDVCFVCEFQYQSLMDRLTLIPYACFKSAQCKAAPCKDSPFSTSTGTPCYWPFVCTHAKQSCTVSSASSMPVYIKLADDVNHSVNLLCR